ncbi:MAG TPA: ABC transporter permease [Micromonosporaceae bacterium]|nr:ABC transporter permease [Micromonosporaceae bacterium]
MPRKGEAHAMAYVGEPGFRDEPDFRGAGSAYQPGSYSVSDYPTDATETTLGLSRRNSASVSSASLDDVFDDPEHGEPGRDRLAVHAVWELLLLLGVGAVGFLLWRQHAELLRGAALKELLVNVGGFGMITLGAGLSLRAAAPNLAVGPVAVAAGIYFAQQGDAGVIKTTGFVVLVAAAFGVALAVMVVGFHVPGWAASLAGAFLAIVWLQQHSATYDVQGGYAPTRHAYYLAGGFAALAIVGGLIGSIKTVRRAVGRFRPVADPAKRRGGVAAGLTGGALVLSTVLAAVGGVLLAANQAKYSVPAGLGLDLTGLTIGAALIGGTSAFGRRGGIFGTVFAVVLLNLFRLYDSAEHWRISVFAMAGAAVGAGLIVTRLVESLGRPRSADGEEEAEDDWTSGGTQPLAGSAWSPPPPRDSWSSSLPAQPSSGRTTDLWSDDRWGSRSST